MARRSRLRLRFSLYSSPLFVLSFYFFRLLFFCVFCFALLLFQLLPLLLPFFFQTQKRVSLLGSVRFAGSEISWPMSGLNGGPKECLQKNERVSEREIDGSELVVAKAYKKR